MKVSGVLPSVTSMIYEEQLFSFDLHVSCCSDPSVIDTIEAPTPDVTEVFYTDGDPPFIINLDHGWMSLSYTSCCNIPLLPPSFPQGKPPNGIIDSSIDFL